MISFSYEWHMHLSLEAMDRIIKRIKLIEARLDEPKWQGMAVGDTIVFHADDGSAGQLRVVVTGLVRYNTFPELLDHHDPQRYFGRARAEVLERLIGEMGYYTASEMVRFGVLGIMVNPQTE